MKKNFTTFRIGLGAEINGTVVEFSFTKSDTTIRKDIKVEVRKCKLITAKKEELCATILIMLFRTLLNTKYRCK